MIKNEKCPIALMFAFIWIGFVCSISFMEAWIKFRALNLTLPIGLSVGRVVFAALNKAECVFAIIIMICLLISKTKIKLFQLSFFSIPVLLLTIQTFFILPALNERVDIILSGNEVLPSFLHFYYLLMEVVKVVCLFIFGNVLFRARVAHSY